MPVWLATSAYRGSPRTSGTLAEVRYARPVAGGRRWRDLPAVAALGGAGTLAGAAAGGDVPGALARGDAGALCPRPGMPAPAAGSVPAGAAGGAGRGTGTGAAAAEPGADAGGAAGARTEPATGAW